jgi:hypothetical protein
MARSARGIKSAPGKRSIQPAAEQSAQRVLIGGNREAQPLK